MNEYSIFTKIDMTTNNIELGKTSYALDDLRTYLIPSISLWQQQYIWSFNLTNSFLKTINIEVNLIYKSWVGVGGAVSIQSYTCENWVCYVFSDSFEVFIFADVWPQVDSRTLIILASVSFHSINFHFFILPLTPRVGAISKSSWFSRSSSSFPAALKYLWYDCLTLWRMSVDLLTRWLLWRSSATVSR